VTRETLRRFYRRNKIGFRCTKAQLYSYRKDQEELDQERYDYAQQLCEYILDPNCCILYCDETSMHVWCRQRKAWCLPDQRIVIPQNPERGSGWTIIGCMGDAILNGGHFEIHRSTNTECFMSFLRALKTKLRPECGDKQIVMVLDNHK
jgi:hypothetical protein